MTIKKDDGLTKHERYRLKDIEAYRKRKREWAKTPSQKEYRRNYMRKWTSENKERVNELARESYNRNKNNYGFKEKRRIYALKNNYNLTLGEFEEMKATQNNKCLICGKDFKELKRQPHVDHDHDTGVIRGLLCGSCNTKLGWYETFSKEIFKYLDMDNSMIGVSVVSEELIDLDLNYRQEGFYKIKFEDDWKIGQWYDNDWLLPGSDGLYEDKDLDEISDKVY